MTVFVPAYAQDIEKDKTEESFYQTRFGGIFQYGEKSRQ